MSNTRVSIFNPFTFFTWLSWNYNQTHIPCSIKNNSKRPQKPQVLLLGPTSISAIKVGGTTIHSGLGIKPGTKLMSLRENKLSEFKLIIINEL